MSIGSKQHKSILKPGIKSYKPIFNLGMKTYSNHLSHAHNQEQSKMSHSNDGVIYNTSNNADIQREPMKYTKFVAKDHTKNIVHSSIEKAKKKSAHKQNNHFN